MKSGKDLSAGLLLILASGCLTAPPPESEVNRATPSPAVPDDDLVLRLVPKGPDRIELSWTDSSTVTTEYRVERRDTLEGPFSERAVLEADSMTWMDRSVSPEREYCYRVTALAGGKAGASEAGCTTTPALAPMTCTDDPKNNQKVVREILESPDPFWVDWREYVGLVDADPSRLVLIKDDAICNALWSETSRSDAEANDYDSIAFYRLGDRYIMTDYSWEAMTTVLDDRMRVILHALH